MKTLTFGASPTQSSTHLKLPTETISVHITNRQEKRYRYRAQNMILNMQQGELRIIEKESGCFVLLDHCDITVKDAQGNALLHIRNGSKVTANIADLTITADLHKIA